MRSNNSSIVTITFFQVEGFKSRFWALSQMQFGHGKMSEVDGVEFYRILGSGRGDGFDWRPEWGRYALMAVWEDEGKADLFFRNNPFFNEYQHRSKASYTVYMRCAMAHGQWAGKEPFSINAEYESGPIAVITRATIKTGYLRQFWKYVAPVANSLKPYKERILSAGIGEWPVVQQATFSIWKNAEAMKDYAYKNPFHSKVVKKTRELGWYKEELFSRFVPYRTTGNWYGEDPLKGMI